MKAFKLSCLYVSVILLSPIVLIALLIAMRIDYKRGYFQEEWIDDERTNPSIEGSG